MYSRSQNNNRQKQGFSLIETVLYVALFTLLSTLTINTFISTIKSFNDLRVSRNINDSSVQILERLTRDIKSATVVDIANSTFITSPGRLTLSTMSASGTPLTVEYYVSGTQLRIKENGVDKGSLMTSRTKIDALVFRYITAGGIVGIKTELHVSSTQGSVTDADNFYSTSELRGMY